MSDEPDTLELDAAWVVLAAPPAELEARLAAASDEAEAALRRQQLEALALLGWSLPASVPPAGLRARLLARLQGDETQLVTAPMLPASRRVATAEARGAPAGGGLLDPDLPAAPAALARPLAAAPRPRIAASTPPPARTWALPLAAVLALCAVGLALFAAHLGRELDRSRALIAASAQDRQQLAHRLAGAADAAELAAVRSQMAEMGQRLALVTATSTAVCPLRPSPGAPHAGVDAGGVLYVAADHQHWFLRAQKLPPAGPGRVYQLWFMVGDKPVRAGTFEMAGEEAVMSSPTMPHGTSAAMVTIEPAGSAGDRPSGPVALYGRQIAPLV